jgi:hypothetical protein
MTSLRQSCSDVVVPLSRVMATGCTAPSLCRAKIVPKCKGSAHVGVHEIVGTRREEEPLIGEKWGAALLGRVVRFCVQRRRCNFGSAAQGDDHQVNHLLNIHTARTCGIIAKGNSGYKRPLSGAYPQQGRQHTAGKDMTIKLIAFSMLRCMCRHTNSIQPVPASRRSHERSKRQRTQTCASIVA